VAEAVLQLLMETDVEGVIGAGRYERSGERSTWRDGYRDRTLDTRLAYKEGEPPVETAATRIFAMLTAATSMRLKAREREEPFGPLMSSCDRRTAIPADFRGEPVKLLADMAARSVNPLLKARLADMCWLLERKRGALAAVAVAAYVETIEAVELGTLKFQYAHNDGASPRATSTT
jgi:Transposase, Mutator family